MAIEERDSTAIALFVRRHPVGSYLALTFAISWGGFLVMGGRGLLEGSNWQTDPGFLVAVTAMLAGPPVAGLVSTVLVSGRAGLRDLFARLLHWRVPGRWYAVALLAAPLLQMAVLLALMPISTEFLPAIFRSDDRAGLLLSGVMVGIVGGFVEELGWTGFAMPRLRKRFGLLSVGLIVGVIWGAWHLLQMWWVGRTSSEEIPLTLYLPLYFLSAIAALTAFRVLMVWVYERTGSLLVAILMHASYIFTTLFVLAPPITGQSFLIYSAAFAVTLWIVVAVIMTNVMSEPIVDR